MPQQARVALAARLDAPAIGNALLDWQHLAQALGVGAAEIRVRSYTCSFV